MTQCEVKSDAKHPGEEAQDVRMVTRYWSVTS